MTTEATQEAPTDADHRLAVAGQVERPVRPVRCWYCGQQMHYSGHVAHEPEVRLTLAGLTLAMFAVVGVLLAWRG